MTKRFIVKDLNIQDSNPNGRFYMLEEQGGVNAFCNIANGLNNKCKRLSDENEQLKQKITDITKTNNELIHLIEDYCEKHYDTMTPQSKIDLGKILKHLGWEKTE